MAKTPKGPQNGKIPVDTNILEEGVRASLTQDAMKSVAADMEQAARDAYYASEIERIKRSQTPSDQIVNVTIDCAPYVPHIMLDHVQFFHGYTYKVASKQAAVLYEQMQRSWQHQDEIDGRSKTESYRRPAGLVLGPRHAGSSTQGANGRVNAEI